jgi:hypothetical protein
MMRKPVTPLHLPAFPRSIREIDPEWLTCVLHDHGVQNRAKVADVSSVRIGGSRGVVSRAYRLKLEWSDPAVPVKSVVVKLPSLEKSVNEEYWYMLEQEVQFYADMSPLVEPLCPHCYFSGIDPDENCFILILEDFGGMSSDRLSQGCSLPHARVAVEQLGLLHRTWWENPMLRHAEWLFRRATPEARLQLHERYDGLWQRFVKTHSNDYGFSEDDLALGNLVAEESVYLWELIDNGAATLVHYDFRPENLMFDLSHPSRKLGVLDWQLVRGGCGLVDLAYFLCTGFRPERRRSVEDELISLYYRTLVAGGNVHYGFEQCIHDWRLSILLTFARGIFIASSSLTPPVGSRQFAMVKELINRSIIASRDHQVEDLLRSESSRKRG